MFPTPRDVKLTFRTGHALYYEDTLRCHGEDEIAGSKRGSKIRRSKGSKATSVGMDSMPLKRVSVVVPGTAGGSGLKKVL